MTTIKDAKTLGELVRLERRAQGLTQEQLAATSGTGIRFIRELEAGKENCRLGLALHVCDTLGLRLSVATRRGDA